MRKVFITIGIILAMISPFSIGEAQELRFFRIGTGGIAGTYYPIGGMIGQAVSNPPGSRPCDEGGSCGPVGLVAIAQSANGSVANVRGIKQGALESGFAQSDIAYWAYTGTGTFEGENPFKELRVIANLYPESIHIVARKDAGIRQVRDLIGKRVSLDEPGSGTLIDAQLVLNAYGISSNEIEAEYIKPDLAIKRIRANKLDAFFIVAGYPARAVTELSNDTGIVLIPVNGPEAKSLVSKNRFFSQVAIPGDTYLGVPQTDTVSVSAQWLVAASVDDELVYGITRALWNEGSRRLLDSGHSKGKLITLQSALDGIAIPLHTGARRFYEEIGMSVE